MSTMRRHLLFYYCCCLLLTSVTSQTVETRLGSINGFTYETSSGSTAEIYLNIPFAKPPVGELRFEKPQPYGSWEPEVRNGTSFGYDCVPHHPKAHIFPTSEDCLTLNVIRPSTKPPPEGFPVLFWVHGGGYEIGSASIYGYKGFAEMYTTKDIIVVTIQYRIGVLGFLATNSGSLPGNLGLWDQALALKFVHENIDSFGGNKDKITVWGYSAGGASVAQLAISPVTQKYVYSSIEMSGSSFASWALGNYVRKHSEELIEELGCSDKGCLKQKSIEQIHEAVLKVNYTNDNLRMLKWAPIVGDDFIPEHPEKLIKKGRKIPSIIGNSNKDAGFFTLMGLSAFIHNLYPGAEKVQNFTESDLRQVFDRMFMEEDYGSRKEEAVEKALKFYRRHLDGDDEAYYIDKFTEFVNDNTLAVSNAREIRAKQQAGWPVYAYQFTHFNDVIFEKFPAVPQKAKGSVHVNEFAYICGIPILGKINLEEEQEKTVADTIQTMIISMAKHSSPTLPDGQAMKDVGKNEEIDYLEISSKPSYKKGWYYENLKFYDDLKTLGYDLIELAPSKISDHNDHADL